MTYVSFASVTAVGVLYGVLILFGLGLRINLWRRRTDTTSLDDILLLPAVFFTLAACVAMILGAQDGFLGAHSPTQSRPEYQASLLEKQISLEKWEYAFWIIDVVAIGFTKLSILFFLRRIFRGHGMRTVFDWCNWTLIALVTAWTIALAFANIFSCGINFFAAWGSIGDLKEYCVNTFALNLAGSATNWALDVLILLEPLVMISTLQMTFSRKASVSAMFLIGTFAVAAGLTRMVVLIKINAYDFVHPSGKLLGRPPTDDLGLVSIGVFWTFMEMGTGCLVACLLPCRGYVTSLTENVGSLRALLSKQSSTSIRNGASGVSDMSERSRNRGNNQDAESLEHSLSSRNQEWDDPVATYHVELKAMGGKA